MSNAQKTTMGVALVMLSRMLYVLLNPQWASGKNALLAVTR